MPHDAHDVALLPGLVASIVHRLAIHRQGIVVDTPGLIPGIEGLIQGLGARRTKQSRMTNSLGTT